MIRTLDISAYRLTPPAPRGGESSDSSSNENINIAESISLRHKLCNQVISSFSETGFLYITGIIIHTGIDMSPHD